MIQTIQFVCPRTVSAGELVMDPNTGAWGYARSHYVGGQTGTFSAGGGYVVTVPGAVSDGAPLYCRNGILGTTPAGPGEAPCAEVTSVMERTGAETTVMIRLM